MIQKHEILELISNLKKNKNMAHKGIVEVFLPIEGNIRMSQVVYIDNSKGLVEDVTDKTPLSSDYHPVFIHTIFCFSVKREGITQHMAVYCMKEKDEVMVTAFIKENNKMAFLPVLLILSNDPQKFKIYDLDGKGVVAYQLSHLLRMVIKLSNIMTCKNITYVDHEPPAKLNKKRIKNGKEPIYAYKTLEVQLNPKYRKGDGTSEKLETMPLHICAGHFKEYSAEKPLLGKFVGRYWWQPHMRGNSKNGLIEKDYVVKA